MSSSASRCGPDHLKPNVARHGALGKSLDEADERGCPLQQPLGYVAPAPVAISHRHPIGRWTQKLRAFRIPIPVPYSGFVFFRRISAEK